MNKQERRSNCPINVALELFGDRWSLLILRDMLIVEKSRYGEFLDSPEAISTNILASRLKQLQGLGLIEKLADPLDRKSFLYLPTDKGVSLLPVLLEMFRWGMEQADGTAGPDWLVGTASAGNTALLTACEQKVQERRAQLAGT